MRSKAPFVLSLSLLAAACQGTIEDKATGGGGAGGTSGSQSSPAACQSIAACQSPLDGKVGPSTIRLLSNQQYNKTVHDLFGKAIAAKVEIAEEFPNDGGEASVSSYLAEQHLLAAEELAGQAILNLPELLPCDPLAIGEAACAEQFVREFGRRAFRRPLGDDEVTRMRGVYDAARSSGGFDRGIEAVVQAMLVSPKFLYVLELDPSTDCFEGTIRLDQHEVACRLSYLLWDSMPDETLLAAADAGELETAEQIAAQARRLLAYEVRSRDATRHFFERWFGIQDLDQVEKFKKVYPDWSKLLRVSMREGFGMFVDEVLRTDGRLETLLTSPVAFVSASSAPIYGVAPPTGGGQQQVTLDPSERAGALTQAAVLTMHASFDQSDPVVRGKFVREQLLCQELPPPPPGLMAMPPEPNLDTTTRERFEQHSTDPACKSCHQLMDPIGFGFENYDAIGRFRTLDNGKPVDASGDLVDAGGASGPFHGAAELAQKLATSDEVRRCAVRQWFRHAFARLEVDHDDASIDRLYDRFAASDYDLRELIVALTETDAFVHRRPLAAECAP